MFIFYFFTVLGSISLWIENYKLIINNTCFFNLVFKRHIFVIVITISFILILAFYDIIFFDNKPLFHLLTYIFVSILFYFINICINISVKNEKQQNDYKIIIIISILNILLGYIYLCIFLYNLNIYNLYFLLPLLYTIIPIISFLFISYIFNLVPKKWLDPKFIIFINKDVPIENIAINLYSFNWFISKIILSLFMVLLTYFISMCTENIIILNLNIIIFFAFILSYFSCKGLNIKLKDPSFKFIFIFFFFSLLLSRFLIGIFIYNIFYINIFKFNYFNSPNLFKDLNKFANFYTTYTDIILNFKSVIIFNKLIYFNLNNNNTLFNDMSNNSNNLNSFNVLNEFVRLLLKKPIYKNNELNYKYIPYDTHKPIIHKILGNKINFPTWVYNTIPKTDFSKYFYNIKHVTYYNLTVYCFLDYKTFTIKFNLIIDSFGNIKNIKYIISELNKYKVSDCYPIKGKVFFNYNPKTILNLSQNKLLLNTIKFKIFVENLSDSISYTSLGRRKIGFIDTPLLGIDNLEIAFSEILEFYRKLIIEVYPRIELYTSCKRVSVFFDWYLVTCLQSLEHKYFTCLTYIHKNHSDLYISMFEMHRPYYYVDRSSHLELHRHLNLRDRLHDRNNNISVDFRRYEWIMDDISIVMTNQSKFYNLYTKYYPLANNNLLLRDIRFGNENLTLFNANNLPENLYRDSLDWLNLNEERKPISKALGLDLIKIVFQEQNEILTFFEPKNIIGVSNEELDSLVQKVKSIIEQTE